MESSHMSSEMEPPVASTRYHSWKDNTPKLYSHLHTYNTVWPSLALECLPDLEHSKESISFRLLTTLHSGGQKEVDFIRLGKYTLPAISKNIIPYKEVKLSDYDGELGEFRSPAPNVKYSPLQNLGVPKRHGDLNCISYIPRNPDLISVGCSKGGIYLIDKTKHASDLEMQQSVQTGNSWYDVGFEKCEDEVNSMAWNVQSSGSLAVVSGRGELKIFDVNSFKSGEKLRSMNTRIVDARGSNAVEWVSGHTSLLVTANESNYWSLVDVRTKDSGDESGIHHKDGINALSVNKHNPYIISTGDSTGLLNIWDLRDMTTPLVSKKVHEGGITTLDFDVNRGQYLLSGSDDSLVQIYDLSNAESEDAGLVFKHGGHLMGLTSAKWIPGVEGLIASTGWDNTLQVWRPYIS